MSLSDIVNQEYAVGFLRRAFATHKTAHTYLFSGPEGVGKFTVAIEWARLLLCEAPVTLGGDEENPRYEPCACCRSCRLWEGQTHPDFFHVHKELREFTVEGKGKAAPVDMPIDVIREFLIAKVGTRPTVSGRKVFVIGEAERLNRASQNALLKVLEEPPLYCCLILLCTRLEKLLPTTKSRAQIVRFGPVEQGYIADHLKGLGLDRAKSEYFARLSQGSLGTACRWAQLEEAGAELYALRRFVLERLATLAMPECLGLADRLHEKAKHILATWSRLDGTISRTDLNRRALKTVIQVVMAVYDDVMKLPLTRNGPWIHADQVDLIQRIAAHVAPEEAADKITDCFVALRWVEAGVNERLILERLLLRLADSAILNNL